MLKKRSSCTSILVGKDASLDGSTMIGRDEDSSYPVGPQAFTVRPALDKKHNFLVSKLTGLKLPVPEHTQRYTCEPNVPASARVSEEGGFNEHNVAMSATETLYNNSHFLGYDPLVKKNSINEDLMLSSTLPYITSAREGVQRLGHLIERYGTGQSNGIAFADKTTFGIWKLRVVITGLQFESRMTVTRLRLIRSAFGKSILLILSIRTTCGQPALKISSLKII